MQVQKEGKIGAVMTVEEGGVYEGSIEKLHTLYDLGVRISTLTWNFPNELGFPNPAQEEGKPYLPDLENGLTPTGITFVEEMERLGLKGPHVSCLYYLSLYDELTAAELCERCDEDKAAISRSLDDLEKNGYITCASGAGKRYKSPLRLTERGKAVGRAIGEKITRIVEAASEGLSEAERQTMYRALALVSENLERIYTHKKTAGDRAARDEQ